MSEIYNELENIIKMGKNTKAFIIKNFDELDCYINNKNFKLSSVKDNYLINLYYYFKDNNDIQIIENNEDNELTFKIAEDKNITLVTDDEMEMRLFAVLKSNNKNSKNLKNILENIDNSIKQNLGNRFYFHNEVNYITCIEGSDNPRKLINSYILDDNEFTLKDIHNFLNFTYGEDYISFFNKKDFNINVNSVVKCTEIIMTSNSYYDNLWVKNLTK